MVSSKPPVTRAALERVLARAAELQAAGGESAESDALTEDQLVELGSEVGLSPDHVRQALAEERARGEPDAQVGRGAGLLGPRYLAAQRVVPGRPEVVLAALDKWMQTEEWMRVVRQREDRMVWEPRADFLGGLRRAFSGRPYTLHRVTEVGGTVVSVDAERSLVALSADLAGQRRAAMGGAFAGVVGGAAVGGVLGILGFMTVVAVVPPILIGATSLYGARRTLERTLQRSQVALEQVLDRLERRSAEPRPPSLLQMIDSALPRLR